ncbi:hypothetical protein [Streptomyces sp. NPDC008125]|uniref:hypothetical protein n=1 Tax=Streptomyces sp. NPDC008125 TaxID=3364811 RepID=UPI0036E33AD6
MADDRDEWLDREAAERLLRGEPVVPPGGQARSAARSLSDVLGAARPESSVDGELPGEEAALAAFRQVGPVRGASGAGRHRRPVGPVPEAGTAPAGGMLDPVRLGTPSSSSRRRERPRFGRPVRIGLAASLAGCALGGVAVAAGTGTLAGVFGGAENGPASTVSVAASPDDATLDPSGTHTPSGAPTGAGAPSGAGSGGTVPGADGGAAPDTDGPDTGGPDTDGPDDGNGTGAEGGSGSNAGGHGDGGGSQDRGTYGGPGGSGGSGDFGSGRYAETVEDCHDYRDGDLDERERRSLAELARGEKNIPEYCARITAAYPGGSVAGDSPDGAAPDGTGYGSGHAGDGKGEWGQDADRQGQSSAYPLRNAPATGPAATTLAAAPPAAPASSAPKTATPAGARTNATNSRGHGHGPGPERTGQAGRTERTGQAERAGQAGQAAREARAYRGGYGGQGAEYGSDGAAEPGSWTPGRAAHG